jgi:hypothetical protein
MYGLRVVSCASFKGVLVYLGFFGWDGNAFLLLLVGEDLFV